MNALTFFQVPLVEIPAIILNDSEVNVTKKRKFAKVTAPSDKNKYVFDWKWYFFVSYTGPFSGKPKSPRSLRSSTSPPIPT